MKHATTMTNCCMKIWSSGQSVLRKSCFGPKYFWAKVGIRQKYFWSRNIPQAKMCLGQSMLGTKVVLGSNWVWAHESTTLKCSRFSSQQVLQSGTIFKMQVLDIWVCAKSQKDRTWVLKKFVTKHFSILKDLSYKEKH